MQTHCKTRWWVLRFASLPAKFMPVALVHLPLAIPVTVDIYDSPVIKLIKYTLL